MPTLQQSATEPPQSTPDYAGQQIDRFLEANAVLGEDLDIGAKQAYQRYSRWLPPGEIRMMPGQFYENMEKRLTRQKDGTRIYYIGAGWTGVALRDIHAHAGGD